MARRASLAKNWRANHRARGTLLALGMLALFVALLFCAPPSLPWIVHLLTGVALAALAAATATLAVREFAGRLNQIRLPGFGKIRTAPAIGAIVFSLMLLWWFNPATGPIRAVDSFTGENRVIAAGSSDGRG